MCCQCDIMINKRFELINTFERMKVSRKQLTPEAIDHLRGIMEQYMQQQGTNEFTDILPFLVTYVYNEAYKMALEDAINELRKI